MANPGYIRSTDGNDADNGSTWALANATLSGAMADQVAGDTIYVSQVHAESTAAATTITMPGTLTSPVKIVCANDGAEPPTTVATTATLTTTGNSSITIDGSGYIYGISFICGTSSGPDILILSASGDNAQTHEHCSYTLNSSASTTQYIIIGSNASKNCQWAAISPTFKFTNAAQGIQQGGSTSINIDGGSISGTSTALTGGFLQNASAGRTADVLIRAFDFSNLGVASYLVDVANVTPAVIQFVDCKLPSWTTGSLITGTIAAPGVSVEMWNCDSGSTNYKFWLEKYSGTIKQETTIVKTSGSSDGTTSWSINMTSNANAEYPVLPLKSFPIKVWNDTTGSAVTITIDIIHDSVTALNDDEVWLEAVTLQTAGAPLGTFESDAKATFLTSAAAQTSSSSTWTTTGLTNPNKQQLSVTTAGTIQKKGYIYLQVCLAKASYTIYVDGKATVA